MNDYQFAGVVIACFAIGLCIPSWLQRRNQAARILAERDQYRRLYAESVAREAVHLAGAHVWTDTDDQRLAEWQAEQL